MTAARGFRRSCDPWSLFDIVDGVNCALYGDVGTDVELARIEVRGATIDSRKVRPGMVFVALQGVHEHGLVHAPGAIASGAVAVLAGNDPEVDDDLFEELLGRAALAGPLLLAADCDGVTALGRLARAWRRRSSCRVVGITGSSGKTSTKDLLRGMLEAHGARVVASHANWNNEIGVPLTLLEADADTDVVICEMGMRGPGQIAYLCDIADPDVGLVTNAGTAHLELLGTREAIRAAKAELFAGTWSGGTVVYPAAQPEIPEAATSLPDRALAFAAFDDEAGEDAAVRVLEVRRTEQGIAGRLDVLGEERSFALPVHGAHNATNLAAATCALFALVGSTELLVDDAFTGSGATGITAGRGDRVVLGTGVVVIDDAYNANPESVMAALDELEAAAEASGGCGVAVLGRMAELGPESPAYHRAVGTYAASLGRIARLVVVGSGDEQAALADGWAERRGDRPTTLESVEQALGATDDWVRGAGVLLVKASNSSGLGRLANGLVERYGAMSPAATTTMTPPAAPGDAAPAGEPGA